MLMMLPCRDIDLDLIRCFQTVVESGGFTRASKRLLVTQSGITLKIKRPEEELNCRLFRRTTKPLELSHEGEIVLGYARRLLDLSQQMAQRVAKPKGTRALRLGVVDHFGPQLLREAA
jgi:DNA-binding transcriptional LysR family regulator